MNKSGTLECVLAGSLSAVSHKPQGWRVCFVNNVAPSPSCEFLTHHLFEALSSLPKPQNFFLD
jgi:hypothetical protein